ncbi:general transcription factor 3C polypeptide 4-like [Clavelina lepadiformis]|uniref:general transcription factor 3C polypeptide 4-like n=1 Tax=Clavelina lepadiformis TaxID=159417 RepID=UPI004041ED87
MKQSKLNDWDKTFCLLNLHNKVVGSSCVEWCDNNDIIVATTKKIVSCDMALMNGGKKVHEPEFTIENVNIEETKRTVSKVVTEYIQEFESACFQSSNTAAFPDYNVYEILLDPVLFPMKNDVGTGYKSIKMSPSGLCKSGGQLLAAVSQNYSVHVCIKENDEVSRTWKEKCELSTILKHHLRSNPTLLGKHEAGCKTNALNLAKEKTAATALTYVAWSNLYHIDSQSVCFLVTSTLNGLIILWKIQADSTGNILAHIELAFQGRWKNVVSLSFCKHSQHMGYQRPSHPPSKLHVAVSNVDGELLCYSLDCTKDWQCSNETSVWSEPDKICVRQMHWFHIHHDESVMIIAKSNVIVVQKLNKNFEVVNDTYIHNAHDLPIVALSVFEGNDVLEIFSSSSDGSLIKFDLCTDPTPKLQQTAVLSKPDDVGTFNANHPTTFHGFTLSPNGAFVALLTSQPKIRLSIQVDNTAQLSLKRLLNPSQASEKFRQRIFLEGRSFSSCIDILEIVRQYYALSKTFECSLSVFLEQSINPKETNLAKLQMRWHLLIIKHKVKQFPRKSSNLEGMALGENQCKDLQLVEEVLVLKQMAKVLMAWFRNHLNEEIASANVPIVQLVNKLKSKKELLTEEEMEVISQIQSLPIYKELPYVMTCAISTLPISLSTEGISAVASDGSRWPVCCLTYTVLQGYEKRKCALSGLYAAVKATQPSWLQDILSSNCIFSDLPLM